MKPESIAIYGGTFNPVHNGHIAALRALAEQTDIGRIYVMPAKIPPHKKIDFGDDPARRAEMLRIAVKSMGFGDRITVSEYELGSDGPSYTWRTLTHFYENVSKDITFLCGGDMFVTLDRWKNAETIFRLARIAYVGRPGADIAEAAAGYERDYGARLLPLEMEETECSSTEIRRMAAQGLDVSAFTPEGVAEYIKANKLYQKRI